jgi:hypothetical protein
MRANRVVVLPQVLDDNLCLFVRIEECSVEQLVPKFAIEVLIVAILPKVARFDEERAAA